MFVLIMLPQVFFLLLILSVLLYFYFTRNFDHWKKKNVPYVPPVPIFGNIFKVFVLKETIGTLIRKMHESTTKPFIGFFLCDEPCLLIRDPELIKQVLIKDFEVFADRSVFVNEKIDPIGSNMLFLMKNPDWREMRRKLSPVFTTGKMKNMFQLLEETSENLINYLTKEVEECNFVIDISEASAKYTTDSITSAAFGIGANCFKDKNSEFRQVSRRVFNWTILERAFSMMSYFVAPKFVSLFHLKFVDNASSVFLKNAFWNTMSEREDLKIVRNDLLDVLNDIKNRETFGSLTQLERDKIVAQAVQFFVAGFDTTSSTISFTLYELACNKDIQSKAREEIKNTIEKNGKLNYDALKDMEYLDMCIKETLRKYPSLPFMDRRCDRDYNIPGTNLILEKGTPIFMSSWGLHFDSNYFPNPDKYDPMRFSDGGVRITPFTYLPFGDGPRNCIGARFATVSSKIGVAKIISQFEVTICDKRQHPLKLLNKGILLAPISNILLKFEKCN